MQLKIILEWDEHVGLSLAQTYPFRESIEAAFTDRNYGESIKCIWIVLTCRPFHFKQRKRYRKKERRFEYDILLDYFLIKNVDKSEKKSIIRKQILEISDETFSKYKFENFNNIDFLSDLRQIVASAKWP
jgi:hypothetical protein